jgi:hypothetical protein
MDDDKHRPYRDFLPSDCDRIVFLHIPKTGGTTLTSLIEAAVGRGAVCPERLNGLPGLQAGMLARYRAFCGHFDQMSIRVVPGPLKIVTMLREPRARIISTYRFWRAHSREHAVNNGLRHVLLAIDNDFATFLRKLQEFATSGIDNMYARAYGGCLPMGGDSSAFGKASLEAFGGGAVLTAAATRFLDSCTAVGILEQYDRSVDLIFRSLKLEPPAKIAARMTTTEVAKRFHTSKLLDDFEVSQEAEEELERLTRFDRIIYEYAISLLEREGGQNALQERA